MHTTFPQARERQRAREDARFASWRREAVRSRGVSVSGMGPGPFEPATDAELSALARADVRRAHAYQASPEGRFQSAAYLIWRATGDERLLNCASRGLEDEAARAAGLLDDMEGPAADKAREALVEFMARSEAA